MEKKLKKVKGRMIFWLLLFVIVLGAAFRITYAFFTMVNNNQKGQDSVTITAGSMKLTYFDGNSTVELENMKPGNFVETKTFSVENSGNTNIDNYGVYLENVFNDLTNVEDLVYKLTCKVYNSDNQYVSDCNGSNGNVPSFDSLLAKNLILVGYTHKYELEIQYLETGKNQSVDMNKKISGNIKIYDLSDIVAVEGVLTNYTEGDKLFVSSINKEYKINSDGSFEIPLLEVGIYDISIINGTDESTMVLDIIKDVNVSIVGNIVSIDKNSNVISINVTKNQNVLKLNSIEVDNG